jgi:polar amino acid transport system substrate-binding protein
LPPVTDDVEQFGIVLNKDSSLTRCVSSAVDALRDDGTLATLQTTWLAEAGKAPTLR